MLIARSCFERTSFVLLWALLFFSRRRLEASREGRVVRGRLGMLDGRASGRRGRGHGGDAARCGLRGDGCGRGAREALGQGVYGLCRRKSSDARRHFWGEFFLGGGSSRWREARWKEAGKVCEKKRREQKKPEKQELDLFFFYPRCCCCCSFSESRPGQSRGLCSLVYTAR